MVFSERLQSALRRRSTATGWRLWVRRLPGLAAVMTVGLLVIEVLLRLVGGSTPPPPLYPGDIVLAAERPGNLDALLGWKMPASTTVIDKTEEYDCTYTTNSLGFRSLREFEILPGEERIAVIGSSFTAGGGVEDDETFVALLEEGLTGTVCQNFAIGAFGIDQMWLTLEKHALPLKPRLVIAGLVRSTLDRCMTAYRYDEVWRPKPMFTFEDGDLVPLTRGNAPPAPWRFVQRHSLLHGVWRKVEHSLLRHVPIGRQWALNRALFERMRDACAAAGADFMVVGIPVNRRKPIPMFASEFEDMGIAYLDLQPVLPAAADALYYPQNGHFNAAGHRFAAKALRAFLLERGWLGETTASAR